MHLYSFHRNGVTGKRCRVQCFLHYHPYLQFHYVVSAVMQLIAVASNSH